MTDKIKFIIAGAQKSGTTALDVYLRKHPNICMANKKEVHFFDTESNFESGTVNYEFYHQFFAPNDNQQILGEATPIYMYWDNAIRRIYEYNPKTKIIVILRNPIDRAYSHWNMERDRGAENLPFLDAILTEPIRIRESSPLQHRVYSYIDRGFYSAQLRRIWHFFPKEQVIILKFDDFKLNPQITMDKVFDFLGVESVPTQYEEIHSREYVSKMDNQSKQYLKTVFEFEIKNLERLLGWDCSSWLE